MEDRKKAQKRCPLLPLHFHWVRKGRKESASIRTSPRRMTFLFPHFPSRLRVLALALEAPVTHAEILGRASTGSTCSLNFTVVKGFDRVRDLTRPYGPIYCTTPDAQLLQQKLPFHLLFFACCRPCLNLFQELFQFNGRHH